MVIKVWSLTSVIGFEGEFNLDWYIVRFDWVLFYDFFCLESGGVEVVK